MHHRPILSLLLFVCFVYSVVTLFAFATILMVKHKLQRIEHCPHQIFGPLAA